MATPTNHSLMSPSGAHRWLNCTAAPRFEAEFPPGASVYAEEGTTAHKVSEISAQLAFKQITKRKFNAELKKIQSEEHWQDEMIKTGEFYAQYLLEKAMSFTSEPYLALEVKVDISDYIPEGYGTCDSVLVGGDTLHITDYKHGKGVAVDAEDNPQMKLYALGALKKYSMIYGGLKIVSMAIVQPRITENVSEYSMTVDELLAWGEEIKPVALKAFSGLGEFHAGNWCKFCRGRAVCRARAENYTALEDFKDIAIAGKLTESERAVAKQSGSPMLTDAEIGELLIRGKELSNWLGDLQDYVLQAILSGKDIAGWKVVEGRSSRVFTDADKAMDEIRKKGYTDEVLYERKPLTLAKLEILMGKKAFAEAVGSLVTSPPGKPTLVGAADKRKAYNPAAADFAGLSND